MGDNAFFCNLLRNLGAGPCGHMNYHFSVHKTTINNAFIAYNVTRCRRWVFCVLVEIVMERVLNDSRSYLYALMYAQFYGIYHHEHYW